MTKGARKFENAKVKAVFTAYPADLKQRLMFLRELIFDTASTTRGVGTLEETLRWGQPSYLTAESGSGSSVRIDRVNAVEGQYAMYFHCQTDLVATFRELYRAEFKYGGNRSILFDAKDEIPEEALRHCVSLALTYHRKKKRTRSRD